MLLFIYTLLVITILGFSLKFYNDNTIIDVNPDVKESELARMKRNSACMLVLSEAAFFLSCLPFIDVFRYSGYSSSRIFGAYYEFGGFFTCLVYFVLAFTGGTMFVAALRQLRGGNEKDFIDAVEKNFRQSTGNDSSQESRKINSLSVISEYESSFGKLGTTVFIDEFNLDYRKSVIVCPQSKTLIVQNKPMKFPNIIGSIVVDDPIHVSRTAHIQPSTAAGHFIEAVYFSLSKFINKIIGKPLEVNDELVHNYSVIINTADVECPVIKVACGNNEEKAVIVNGVINTIVENSKLLAQTFPGGLAE